MNTKVCTNPDCPHQGKPQPFSEFHRHRGHKDGHASRCKTCAAIANRSEKRRQMYTKYNNSEVGRKRTLRYERKEESKEKRRQYRERNLDHYVELWRAYNNSERGRSAVKRYAQSSKGKRAARRRQRKYRSEERYIKAERGRRFISRLVERGVYPSPRDIPCTDCQEEADQYHHFMGYDDVYQAVVVAICARCHKHRHMNITAYPDPKPVRISSLPPMLRSSLDDLGLSLTNVY